jgi:hypothetical protein
MTAHLMLPTLASTATTTRHHLAEARCHEICGGKGLSAAMCPNGNGWDVVTMCFATRLLLCSEIAYLGAGSAFVCVRERVCVRYCAGPTIRQRCEAGILVGMDSASALYFVSVVFSGSSVYA